LFVSVTAKVLSIMLFNHSHGRAAVVRQPLYLNAVGESHRDQLCDASYKAFARA